MMRVVHRCSIGSDDWGRSQVQFAKSNRQQFAAVLAGGSAVQCIRGRKGPGVGNSDFWPTLSCPKDPQGVLLCWEHSLGAFWADFPKTGDAQRALPFGASPHGRRILQLCSSIHGQSGSLTLPPVLSASIKFLKACQSLESSWARSAEF
eukprot:1161124-Pelagomonas_calceolata.AAC.7